MADQKVPPESGRERKKGRTTMAIIPESVRQAWELRSGPAVLVTTSRDNVPNAIYVTCVGMMNDETVVVANNYFHKTLRNIAAGHKGSLLFITPEKKSFQLKGGIEYHENGPVFEYMKSWNPPEHPGHGAVALRVEEVYSGAERLAPPAVEAARTA
jgi:predicted pyridoxine 5'-phosphate oxidase superfamily flavin-nucleotide-binding protein